MSMSGSTHYVPAGASTSNYNNPDKFINRYCERFQIKFDRDCTHREIKLTLLQMFLDGTIYDNLSPFHMEYVGGTGGYVKLCNRRPSVLYHLCKIIVNESVGMLFGEGHFPQIKCGEDHANTTDFLNYINRVSKVKQTMLNAAYVGSIGSVCLLVKVLNKKFYFDVLNTKHLTPYFDQQDPDKLILLQDKKKTDGATLISQGYSDIPVENKNKYYYLEREWNTEREIYYKPYLCDDQQYRKIEDKERSYDHDLGFVPAIWVQNMPKAHHIDGDCTFQAAIDISVEIDYHLSQVGRGLYYNGDPTLFIKNPSNIEGTQLVKSAIVQLDEEGDAFYAEIKGNSVDAVLNYVKLIREYGLEAVRGNRSSPDKLHAAQSGRALQMMNHPLVTLVDEMRLTYGDNGLLKLYCMVIYIYNSGKFEIDDGGFSPSDCADHLSLFWQDWYPATGRDKLEEAQAIQIYRGSGVLSKETVTEYIAEEYGIENIEDEIASVDKEITKADNENGSKNESASVDREPKESSGA